MNNSESGPWKILYIQQDGLITGSAISLRHFLNAINRNIFLPEVLLCKEGPARNLFEELGIKVHVFKFSTFWTFPGPQCLQLRNFLQLKALIPNHRLKRYIRLLTPDLIHINDKASINVGISMKRNRLPIVQHSRSSYNITSCKINKFLSSYNILKYSDHIICISEDERDGFEKSEKVTTLFNTVDFKMVENALKKRNAIRTEFNIGENEIVIGMMANINAKKGAWSFLDMSKVITNKYPELKFKFLLVGEASKTGKTVLNNESVILKSPHDYLNEFIDTNNLKDKVIITGFRKDNLEVLGSMDILVVANSNGVLGRQPIEAQALGIPFVAVEGHSGKSSIVKNGITGTVISNPLKLDELIEEIIKNIKQPENRKRLVDAGIQYAKANFSPEINIKKLESIYKNLLQIN